jgi:hypothetical protein
MKLYRKATDIKGRIKVLIKLADPTHLPPGRDERITLLSLSIRTLEELVESPPRLLKTPEANLDLLHYWTFELADIMYTLMGPLWLAGETLNRSVVSAWERLMTQHAQQLPPAALVNLYVADVGFEIAAERGPAATERLVDGTFSLLRRAAAEGTVWDKGAGSRYDFGPRLLHLFYNVAIIDPSRCRDVLMEAFPAEGGTTALGNALEVLAGTAALPKYLPQQRAFDSRTGNGEVRRRRGVLYVIICITVVS